MTPEQVLNAIKNKQLLELIYYSGAKTKKHIMISRIQKWYRKKLLCLQYDDNDWSKPFFIRMIFHEYQDEWLVRYANGVIHKCRYKTFSNYTGSKKSELRRWIFDNMTIEDLGYKGW